MIREIVKDVAFLSQKSEPATMEFKSQVRSFTGFTAQIIQHELNHVSGKII